MQVVGTDAAEPSVQVKQLAGGEPIVEPKVFGQETDLAPYGLIPGRTPEYDPSPLVGLARPRSKRIEVLFPAPLGPRNPKISPRRTCRFRLRTATLLPKVFRRLCVSMAN